MIAPHPSPSAMASAMEPSGVRAESFVRASQVISLTNQDLRRHRIEIDTKGWQQLTRWYRDTGINPSSERGDTSARILPFNRPGSDLVILATLAGGQRAIDRTSDIQSDD